jgi:class 3 adenylate cyclase
VAGAALAQRAGVLLMASAVLLHVYSTSVVVSLLSDGLVAPLLTNIIETAAFVVAMAISLAGTRHREAFVLSRFEQHLAPAVVRRILERPGMAKLRSERREVTALFTDVEGFTAMTHHIDPAILVNTLDNYFEGMVTIIIAHGGMIDKVVGDAVHALFNAPNDLKNHPQKAVECAIALRSWSELFRHRPEVAAIGFGSTRIGLETGPAIVGDVGIRTKLDYTAHGDAVNVAARLEVANKELGSSICIGPVAASRCDKSPLRTLGKIIVRGRDDVMTVFEPTERLSDATLTTMNARTIDEHYDLDIGGNFQPSLPTAMTASVRLDTPNALRIAETWFFTVGSAKLRTRQIALLLFPSIISDSTSTCRSVRPRSAGKTVGRLTGAGVSLHCRGKGSSRARISGGI